MQGKGGNSNPVCGLILDSLPLLLPHLLHLRHLPHLRPLYSLKAGMRILGLSPGNIVRGRTGMEKAQRRWVEPARTNFSEKEMELFRKLTERYPFGASKRWVKISQAWDKAIQTWEGEECPYQPRTPKQFNTYFNGTWDRQLEREQKWQKPDASDAPSEAPQKHQRRPRDVLDPKPAPPQHNRRTPTLNSGPTLAACPEPPKATRQRSATSRQRLATC